eukprot:CAMPEP_0206498548 /NCGR_PEP_ID=MMETSP0324_2-20121206/51084_1 /ASSEMBLY_ACC=CAM_ASM_000836 /TAXON_ID=2866 /ORGANISM="Crypthecodinium cohnii, Strain Seligo" /LENGTH=542 /DNA_ID=CAMNT_0053984805 /DNA_START=195 /DNA_END=1823 /DNA_ORIENTATION=+
MARRPRCTWTVVAVAATLAATTRAARPTPTQTKMKRKMISALQLANTSQSLRSTSDPEADDDSTGEAPAILKANCGNICENPDDYFFGAEWTGILAARTEDEVQQTTTRHQLPKWKGRLTCGQYSRILEQKQADSEVCLYAKVDDTKPELAVLQQKHPHIVRQCCVDPSDFRAKVKALQAKINDWSCTNSMMCQTSPWELQEQILEIALQVQDAGGYGLKKAKVNLEPEDVARPDDQIDEGEIAEAEKKAVKDLDLSPQEKAAAIIREYFQDEQLQALVNHLHEAVAWVLKRKHHHLKEVVNVFNAVEDYFHSPDNDMFQHKAMWNLLLRANETETKERQQIHWLLQQQSIFMGTDEALRLFTDKLNAALFEPVQEAKITEAQAKVLLKKISEKIGSTSVNKMDVLFNVLQTDKELKKTFTKAVDTEILQKMQESLDDPPLEGILKAVVGDHLEEMGEVLNECKIEHELVCEGCEASCKVVTGSLEKAYNTLSGAFYIGDDHDTPAMEKYLGNLTRAMKGLERKHREIMVASRLYKMGWQKN